MPTQRLTLRLEIDGQGRIVGAMRQTDDALKRTRANVDSANRSTSRLGRAWQSLRSQFTRGAQDFVKGGLVLGTIQGTLNGLTRAFRGFVAGSVDAGLAFDAIGSRLRAAATVMVTVTPAPTAPAPPTGLSAAAVAELAAIRLTWTASASGDAPIGYQVERSLTGTGGWEVIQDRLDDTDYVDADLPLGTRHYYRIRAENVAGDSAYATADATTAAARYVPPIRDTALEPLADPPPPRNLRRGTSETSVTLYWDAPLLATTPLTYRVDHRIDRQTDTWRELAAGIVGHSYELTDLPAGRHAFVRVRAENAAGKSRWVDDAVAVGRPLALINLSGGQYTAIGATGSRVYVRLVWLGNGRWGITRLGDVRGDFQFRRPRPDDWIAASSRVVDATDYLDSLSDWYPSRDHPYRFFLRLGWTYAADSEVTSGSTADDDVYDPPGAATEGLTGGQVTVRRISESAPGFVVGLAADDTANLISGTLRAEIVEAYFRYSYSSGAVSISEYRAGSNSAWPRAVLGEERTARRAQGRQSDAWLHRDSVEYVRAAADYQIRVERR